MLNNIYFTFKTSKSDVLSIFALYGKKIQQFVFASIGTKLVHQNSNSFQIIPNYATKNIQLLHNILFVIFAKNNSTCDG